MATTCELKAAVPGLEQLTSGLAALSWSRCAKITIRQQNTNDAKYTEFGVFLQLLREQAPAALELSMSQLLRIGEILEIVEDVGTMAELKGLKGLCSMD